MADRMARGSCRSSGAGATECRAASRDGRSSLAAFERSALFANKPKNKIVEDIRIGFMKHLTGIVAIEKDRSQRLGIVE